ncbi:MAG: phospholipid carrier-dependent glycosyltransferase, partial [bacterium]|nr:phospholipid carrier-dependent glycosyltransferase [bacterium]
MNLPLKRLAGAFALLLIFALALGLRFYGLDWSFKDGVHTFHPDENHYHFCANDLRPQWLSEEEKQLPFLSQIKLFYQRNLEIQGDKGTPNNPALRPRNYNYGTFPLHLYLAYKAYLTQHRTDTDDWVFMAFPDWLSLTALLFCAWLGLRLVWKTSKDFHQHRGRKISWYRDPQRLSTLFPALILPFLGLGLAIYIPKLLVNYAQYSVVDGRFILIIGRTLTAWAGAFTVLLAYLIGRDAYNRATGLVAALMLATAMLHVQTSHFATVDVMLGFWLTAGVYCFMKVAQKPRLLWYVLGALCTGFAVATKWSGILLPGILLIAHTAAIWQDERVGRIGRWIHGFWLGMLSLFTLHFYKAASSTQPSFDVTLAAFRDFYLKSYSIGGYTMFLLNPAVITVLVLLFLASLVALSYRKQFHKGQIGFIKPFFLIYRPWFCLALAILVGVLAFFFAEPMAYFDAKSFAEDMIRESGFHRTGDIPIIYTLQYRNTPSVFYTLDNLFYPSLDWLTASFVLAGCGYAVWRLLYRRSSSDVVLAAWVIPSFLLYSTFHSKFPRYMDAILPVMMVFGAKLIVDLARIQPYFYAPSLAAIPVEWKWRARRLGIAGGTVALVSGLIYGCSYVRIYDKPHTLVQASQYLKETMKPGQALTMQSWDEGIPGFHVESSDRIFIHDQRDLERTPARRAQYYAQVLNRYDYIVLQSKRGYGTTLRNPDYYPIANQFLKAFFAEQLGFRIAKVIDNPPQFLGWEFRTDLEDETARIYDHPKVIIFEKTQKFSVEQLQQLILSPPAWVGEITAREILTLQDGYPV